jgi:hypothetical protein
MFTFLGDFIYCLDHFSIYKTTLKSENSISEVNQVAQVCFSKMTCLLTHSYVIEYLLF